ncbi:hypothetical protein [Prevotella dentasini]|uniref:hypothetical protein n=1 Tax=Prevotella dentasini TaxID=589537 RepID=UPI000AC0E882|nr:hypothetical protein [Prevotella dentasini]
MALPHRQTADTDEPFGNFLTSVSYPSSSYSKKTAASSSHEADAEEDSARDTATLPVHADIYTGNTHRPHSAPIINGTKQQHGGHFTAQRNSPT